MTDIVETLRECADRSRASETDYRAEFALYSPPPGIFEEAAKEIEALRWRDKVHCNVIDRMAAEIARHVAATCCNSKEFAPCRPG